MIILKSNHNNNCDGNMMGLVINNACRSSGKPGCAKTYQNPQLRPPN